VLGLPPPSPALTQSATRYFFISSFFIIVSSFFIMASFFMLSLTMVSFFISGFISLFIVVSLRIVSFLSWAKLPWASRMPTERATADQASTIRLPSCMVMLPS
jgi:hypothetical protein